jgi:peptidoglycan biosynthesis protein MviN/MurJ (putative lipid II flippase)
MSFLRIESYKRGIVVSTIFNLFAKGLVFLVSLLVAYYFGSGEQTDVYFYAYNVVVLISGFFTMLNSTVLIPEAMRMRVDDEVRSSQFLIFFIYLYAAVTVILSLAFFMWPVSTFTTISNFNIQTLQEHKFILQLAIPLILLMTLTNLLTEILISYRFFSVTMIVSIINSIISITFLALLREKLSIGSLLLGLLTGFMINLVSLFFLIKKYLKWNFFFSLFAVDKRIWRNVALAQAGNITTVLNSYVPLFLLSGFNPGIITTLTFAQQLSVLPNSLFTNHFTSVAAIKFNELYSNKSFEDLNKIFTSTAEFLVFILMPVSGLMFFFSTEIVTIVFKHGKFDETGVANASMFLKYLGLQLPLLAINTLFSRLLMAGHKVAQSFAYQIAFNILLIILLFVGIEVWGIVGYPLALVAAYLLNIFACYYLEKFFFNIIHYRLILRKFFLALLANACISGLLYVGIQRIAIDDYILRLSVVSVLYLFLIHALNSLFHLNDTSLMFVNKLIRRNKS